MWEPRNFRFLLVVYCLGLPLLIWELNFRPDDAGAPTGGSILPDVAVIDVDLYQGSADAEFALGYEAVLKGDLKAARRHYEAALDTGVKTNENLFYFYIETLVQLGEDQELIDKVVEQWRWNFPHSQREDPRESRNLGGAPLKGGPKPSDGIRAP